MTRCSESEEYLKESVDNDFSKFTGGVARKLSYNAVAEATNHWSDKLGEGGFGEVYKGFLKEDYNCYVAVKKLLTNSKQGQKEYEYEIKILSQSRHRNIVQLIGWSSRKKLDENGKDDQLLLVYEFMPNGSLDSYLFKEKCSLLQWDVRYKIDLGVASGLQYLHEGLDPYVVHRDLKPSNIMLDSDFKPKIGDFGLARLADGGLPHSTYPAGTPGYFAPEYANGRATKEADVYSFGVITLEIACGRKMYNPKAKQDEKCLRKWVRGLYGEGKMLEAIDPRLKGDFDKKQAECLMIVGLLCSHPDEKLRPTMEKAIHLLKLPFSVPADSDHSFSMFDSYSDSDSDLFSMSGSSISTLFSTTINDLFERKLQLPRSDKNKEEKNPAARILGEKEAVNDDQKFVYEMYLHCEACVKEAEDFTAGLKGVECVKGDSEANELTVNGKIDSSWIKSELVRKFPKREIKISDKSWIKK